MVGAHGDGIGGCANGQAWQGILQGSCDGGGRQRRAIVELDSRPQIELPTSRGGVVLQDRARQGWGAAAPSRRTRVSKTNERSGVASGAAGSRTAGAARISTRRVPPYCGRVAAPQTANEI